MNNILKIPHILHEKLLQVNEKIENNKYKNAACEKTVYPTLDNCKEKAKTNTLENIFSANFISKNKNKIKEIKNLNDKEISTTNTIIEKLQYLTEHEEIKWNRITLMDKFYHTYYICFHNQWTFILNNTYLKIFKNNEFICMLYENDIKYSIWIKNIIKISQESYIKQQEELIEIASRLIMEDFEY